ncbi:excinuclease ABC subunit A [Weissella confusa]|uniref:Excinuclease ABC subunit A n=1 Tax=Weissella confusa TaxID=1583 RepID=A0AAJ2YX84_WEICO|nr:Y-family DNA polymerase [Weissella confusa]MBJ7693668.1 Y-family DNA polymerase [Weissella confusa]NBA10751.1 excinuclease ABC subunit A [Weissella confusa]QBZ03767.1 excinuclease ABC subunit A [Weissella confusa]
MVDVYQKETARHVMVIDSKSFYASVESVDLGLNPLKSLLVVMSQQENTNGGLVLAASPQAKKVLGVSNVMRQRDVPRDPRLAIVQPRMNYYIQKNKQINDIYRKFVAEEDLHIYSIDESLLDLTDSWRYLESKYHRTLTDYEVARIIQQEVRDATGIYLTVGIGDNPAMAKMALDLTAKHADDLIGEWHYETIPDVLWPIEKLDDVWSIGSRTAKKLRRLGIFSMRDLAATNPYRLKEKFGVKGVELYALAWGIDRSLIKQKYRPKESSFSNGQVLPRDYDNPTEIEVVIREIGEQVASRLRAKHMVASQISLGIGFGYRETNQSHGFGGQLTIDATNLSLPITNALRDIFRQHYEGQVVRNVYVSAGRLAPEGVEQIDLFTPVVINTRQRTIDTVIDDIRKKFGVGAVFKSSSVAGGTMLNRIGLVGGHNGGNAYG